MSKEETQQIINRIEELTKKTKILVKSNSSNNERFLLKKIHTLMNKVILYLEKNKKN